MEEVPLGLVEYFMKCGLTYEEISLELRQRFPNNSRGFSPRSVRCYCKTNNVTHMTTDELESIVKEAVMEVLLTFLGSGLYICSFTVLSRFLVFFIGWLFVWEKTNDRVSSLKRF